MDNAAHEKSSNRKDARLQKKRKIDALEDSKINKVSLDQLQWNEVPFPERFDDAEGFLGLEEISDVEVVKDPKLGKVEYRLASRKDAPEAKRASKKSDGKTVLKTALETSHSGSEDEWSGFDDSQSPAKSADSNAFSALDSAPAHEDFDMSDWNQLSLSTQTLASLARLQFSCPTPIQKAAIPVIKEGHDVIGKASTGSGKTLAFGIPIYEDLQRRRLLEQQDGGSIVAMILSPTRELAHQLSSHLTDLAMSDMAIATLTGGLSVQKQQRLLARSDIVIATPGRLWEILAADDKLIEKLGQIKYLVLDEADRLLAEGHFKEVGEIMNALERFDAQGDSDTVQEHEVGDSARQTLVFSATFQKGLQQRLAGKINISKSSENHESMEYLLKQLKFREARPQFIDMDPESHMASRLKESLVECEGAEKDLYLYTVSLLHSNKRMLLFTNSIASVRRLTPLLQNLNLTVFAIHSQMPQKARLRAIERFSAPAATNAILVATDVAARGLDIQNIDLIVHYHVPHAADMYIHRSGRTARATKGGESILLCSPDEVQGVRRLVAKVHAQNGGVSDAGKGTLMQTLELDRQLVNGLRPRVTLAKKISDAGLAREKKHHEDSWLRSAAEDLGVDYDSEEFEAEKGAGKGRGHGRKQREKEARSLSKEELRSLRAELKQELTKRVNVGVSEKYLTAGGLDIDALVMGEEGHFLGR